MILPTYPRKIPQTSPFHLHKQRHSQTDLLVKGPGNTFQGGPVGEIFESKIEFHHLNQRRKTWKPPRRWSYRFNLVKVPRDLTKRPPTPPQNGGEVRETPRTFTRPTSNEFLEGSDLKRTGLSKFLNHKKEAIHQQFFRFLSARLGFCMFLLFLFVDPFCVLGIYH